jgi:hypothetical protein
MGGRGRAQPAPALGTAPGVCAHHRPVPADCREPRVGGLGDTSYQFFMPIALNMTLLSSFYPSDNFLQENM